ncbi:MAG: hypothetical protein HRU39_05455 [Salinicola sp.]|uniref:hypothetical protein n=1 Tax=Salinicola sp. TaxID=1978524 RepID=UPI001E10A946|nr:hypothetical protein [Salinicola sp.]NRB55416.1 hypothetical protein [Salinicola sp.]
MSESQDQLPGSDGLGNNYRDVLAALGRGIAGAVPVAGGMLAEIVGAVIPGQRADRITAYLRALSERVDQMDREIKENLGEHAEKIDLIEEGGYQAARATTQERIGMIVEAVTRGLSASETDVVRRKRLLVLLGELDEDEVALLNAYGQSYGSREGNPFAAIDRPRSPTLSSGQDELDRHELYQSGQDHLIRLKLLRKNFSSVKRGELPEFDRSTGEFKHRVEVSPLGRLLLKEVGMPSPFDQE